MMATSDGSGQYGLVDTSSAWPIIPASASSWPSAGICEFRGVAVPLFLFLLMAREA
jgi:hypothetical protein